MDADGIMRPLTKTYLLFFFRASVFMILSFLLLWLRSIEELVQDRVNLAVEDFTANEGEPNTLVIKIGIYL